MKQSLLYHLVSWFWLEIVWIWLHFIKIVSIYKRLSGKTVSILQSEKTSIGSKLNHPTDMIHH